MINKKRKGFTLVEMIVVVTILGVISSIALVKYSKVQESAKMNADYTNAANIVTAASMAINDDENIAESLSVESLKEKGYLNTVPVPQSTSGKFELVISDNGTDISVNVNSKQFYPR
ncbi:MULTISPECIES: prepilin-type N-terminal cleavage/methylation domain-containing protein [unclassified Clostridioides]|uniref:type II secretion system protein n=1 Tax=unclassified Clostridioides TaxID=2635829 RepID=UPI001D103B12|nr:prepilin-type N-terminal cleavage/methylation domain-containing protein [Clostridioides sp. ZZV14-6150]MCC0723855.1 prepilin-type N-terminal cleavage/methylation domain-containing protein [Clostridioides sp. ZZV14-6104]MCC0744453.1 prepilin-type N-terminal cleavage/methylation domain-containing protein [Clostridioides sp. ZZV14-6044]MCC0751974.1 prepilin-type N-terminal cleavage/methylation domain-containing protein [Clostridioides sp. ZZV13-5731]